MSEPTGVYKQSGHCPYCNANNYDAAQTEERHVSQDKMFCNQCDQWSIRQKNTGAQYPLQEPLDKESSPCTRTYG